MCAKLSTTESLVVDNKSLSYGKYSNFCLLITREREFFFNKITPLVDDLCQVEHCNDVEEADQWLADELPIHLIITDTKHEKQVTDLVRNSPIHRHVPILMLCRSAEVRFSPTLLSSGLTDVLALNESESQIKAKIQYYLTMNEWMPQRRNETPMPATHHFQLPWWKRLIDIAVSLTALTVLSPLLLVVAIAIVIDSKGPAFYAQKRAGTNFRVFNIYKFRTMKVRADQQLSKLASHNIYANSVSASSAESDLTQGSNSLCRECQQRGVACQQLLFDQNRMICERQYLQQTGESAKFMKFRNDPRITRIGTFLRNSSIDELPQLLNVLLGDMSLVGNRPLPLYEAEKLTSNEYAQRFAGPAGLTGLWQVKKRAKGQGTMSDRERMQLDITYATSFSFKTDAYIIWRTFFSLWQKENV